MPMREGERKSIFDISCRAISGEEFIIEIQRGKMQYFKDRAVYYTTFPIQRQAKRGDWSFKLEVVYFIAILDFDYDEDLTPRKLLREVSLKDQDGVDFYDKLHFIFLQMPLFEKKEHQLETHFDKWLFFLQNLENFDEIPQVLNEPIFKKGFETARIAKMKTTEYMRYEKSRMALLENQAVIDTALMDGEIKGKIEVVEAGFHEGWSIEYSAKITRLPISKIQEIYTRLSNSAKQNSEA
jgi:predicted transposase/invertase (TIGR01784 family)